MDLLLNTKSYSLIYQALFKNNFKKRIFLEYLFYIREVKLAV